MNSNNNENPIGALQERLGANWSMIARARENAVATRARFKEELAGLDSDDSGIIVFGSLSRDEFTSGSDIDWTLLVDGQASPEHLDNALEIAKYVREVEGKPPGREGTFGGLASSHDLIHKIGEDDTNRNTTQRILLLLESAAIGRSEAHERVVRNVLRRYVQEDYGLMHSGGPFQIPRFLQNDIARYWRTVAVDFAYKQRQREDKGWALRVTKLRMSRKLTYTSGLLMCFSCDFELFGDLKENLDEESRLYAIVDHLVKYSQKTPLEILAQVLLPSPQLDAVARDLFDAYNEFLELLDNEEKRKHLDTLERDQITGDALYEQTRKLGHRFQDSLTKLFLEENGTPLFEMTKAYGVF
jgi:predicted nucleotidyltransferase